MSAELTREQIEELRGGGGLAGSAYSFRLLCDMALAHLRSQAGIPLYVIFDGPPSHESGRFVEVETAEGRSVSAGAWKEYSGHAGLWRLGPFYSTAPGQPAGYVSAWIPVSERLPEPEKGADFVPVLFNIKGTPKSVCAGRFLSGKKLRFRWRSLQGLECTDADVTHWMPLPAPPAGEGADRP